MKHKITWAILLVLMSTAMLFGIGYAQDQVAYEKKVYIKPGPGPMDATPTVISLTNGLTVPADGNYTMSLDGTWKLTSSGSIS